MIRWNFEQHQKIWAKLIPWNFRLTELEFEYLDTVLTVSQINLILRKEFEFVIEAIELGSLRAQQEQARYLEQQEPLDEDEKQPLLEPPPRERVLETLSQIEAGQSNLWCSLCFELTLEADSTHYGEPFRSSLTNLPGWIEAEDSTKEKIFNAARLYLSDGDPENQAWLGTNNFRYSALLGYQALSLLLQKAPSFIFTLSAEEWQKWTAIILAYPNWGRTEDQGHRQILIKKAYENAFSEFIKILIILIEKQNRERGYVEVNHLIKNCWDEKLSKAIFDKAQDEELTDKSLGNLLENLLRYGFIEAKVFAESLITSPLPSSSEERAKAVAAACALMLYAEDADWSVVWPAIQQDTEFGREVIEKITSSVEYSGSIEQRVPEQYIADLYIFLTKQYPDSDGNKQNISEDEKLTGISAYVESVQEHNIKTWKDYIPQRLQERGTPQGCEALRKIICELPEIKDKLQWRLLEAEALTRRQTWQPLQPEEILQIINNNASTTMKTILVLSSSPIDGARLRLEKEVREIDEGLRRSHKRDQFKLEQKWAVRPDDLRRALLDFNPQIVHFCGHGSGKNGLILEDEIGQAQPLPTEALANLFKRFAKRGLECVVLNACYSEIQADAIAEHINYVVGMNDKIGDDAAIKFAVGFYDELGAGWSYEDAYNGGCDAIALQGIPEELTPVLKKKTN